MATPYIGNNDYRGYLNYLATNGDQNAKTLLGLVGNDGKFSNGETFLAPLSADVNNANTQYYQQFVTGNAPGTGGTSAGSGVSAAEPDTTQADLAYLDDQEAQINTMLGSAGRTLQNGVQQINDSYNKETGRANSERDNAIQGIETRRVDTTKDKQAGIGNVNTNSRMLSESVRRILSLAGGVNNTAYTDVAPNAIVRDASIKRTGVNETYGRNFRALDDQEGDTKTKFAQLLEDLLEQKNTKESGLREGVLTQEQQLLNSKADVARQREIIKGGGYSAVRRATAPMQGAISDKQTQLDNLFNQFRTPLTYKAPEVKAAELGGYDTTKTGISQNGSSAGAADSPYANFVKKKFETAAA